MKYQYIATIESNRPINCCYDCLLREWTDRKRCSVTGKRINDKLWLTARLRSCPLKEVKE